MTRATLLAGLVGLASATLAACSDTPTAVITQLNLDRPVDVAFACYGGMRVTGGMMTAGNPSHVIVPTAMPTVACETLSPADTPRTADGAVMPILPVVGQEDVNGTKPVPSWYAFILQSAAGTVAVARWDTKAADTLHGGFSDQGGDFQVLDADPLTPGKNAISIGEDPVAIITDKAGCFQVTANAGSCDLSELEINSALDDISGATTTGVSQVRIDRKAITYGANKPLLGRPAAMVAEPGASANEVGKECPGVSGGKGQAHAAGKVYIAYPSCHIVAGVETQTGQVFSAIRFDQTGAASIVTDLTTLNCPADCTDPRGTTGGGAATEGPRPVSLDLRFDTRMDATKASPTLRLAIGAEKLARVTVVDLDPATFAPTTVLQVPLEDPTGKLGVTAVALSPQIGMGGDAVASAVTLGDNGQGTQQAQFVYAVTSDATVRVTDVLNLKRECDTQIDGRFLRTAGLDVAGSMCIAIDTATKPRRAGAQGPGIELPNHGIPTSVMIYRGGTSPPHKINTDTNVALTDVVPAGPAIWVGHFAAITAASGTVFIVNIDDDYVPDAFSSSASLVTQPVLVMAHQLRDNFSNRAAAPPQDTNGKQQCSAIDPSSGGNSGGPRLSAPPAQTPPTNTLSTDLNPILPKFLQQVCKGTDTTADGILVSELEFGATATLRDQVYPDLKSVDSETWTITYEGTLSLDNAVTSVDGPTIREATLKVDNFGMHLLDQAAPFCDIGVELYDVVDVRGCDPANGDAECPANYTCFVHPRSTVGIGACMLKSEAPRLSETCLDFLTTQRRYTVGQTKAGELQLLERKRELAMTPVDGCVDDDQCTRIAAVATIINPGSNPAGTTWSCQADPLRAPVDTGKRCVQTCSSTTDCSAGSICRKNPGDPPSAMGVCMEGVQPPQVCINGPQRFDVRASEAFTMIGQRSGYVHPIVRATDGRCVKDPNAPSVQIGRIPLKAPVCNPADAATPNPCQATVMQPESRPNYTPGTCTNTGSTLSELAVPAIRVSNKAMSLTLVNPTYPGDQTCFQDRLGTLGNVPFAVTGYRLEFEQKAGFQPFQLQLFGLVTPARVVRGPSESIWVIDDGDFISQSITQSSTRGRVFRIETTTLVGNTLQ